MRVVLDTCILKLATLPNPDNPSGLIAGLVTSRLIEAWASPAMQEEYSEVLARHPDFLSEITSEMKLCHPVSLLNVVRHEPDNRFLECAFTASAGYLLTVNTAPGHFDQTAYDEVKIATPGHFLRLPAVQPLIRRYLEGD